MWNNNVIETSPPTLHKLQICDPALEILDEVQESSNLVNWITSLEEKKKKKKTDFCDPLRKCTAGPLTESNRNYWLVPVFDWLDSLIGVDGLQLGISRVSSPICNPNFSLMGGVGKEQNN
jgi:hypothetical protein